MVLHSTLDTLELGTTNNPSIETLCDKAANDSEASSSPISVSCERNSFVRKHWDPQWKKAKDRIRMMSFWACLIVVGQTLISLVALTFFALINFTHTPMHQTLAAHGQASPRALAYTITAIATLFSACTAFLFCRSLVLFLTFYSHRPTSLSSFMSMSTLSRGAPIFSKEHFKWSFLSIMTLILLNSLTASFAAIFSPTPILLTVPILGREFAIDSQLFNQALGLPKHSDLYPKLTPAQLALNDRAAAVFQPVSLGVAYSTASKELGFPSMIGYLGTTMNSSTGGIVPTIPQEIENVGQTRDPNPPSQIETLRPRFKFATDKPGFKPPKNLPYNYTTFQQGFTVDVKCELLLNVTNNTDRPTMAMSLEKNITLPDNSTLGFWRVFWRCPLEQPKNTTRLLRDSGNMLVGQTCDDQHLSGRNVTGGRLLLLAGQGLRYASIEPRVCQFTPFFTTVEVEYTSSVNITRVMSKSAVTAATLNVVELIYGGILDAMSLYASDLRNKVAEDIISLLGLVSDLLVRDESLFNGILENYFRGLIEGRATLIKTPPISLKQGGLIAASLDDLSDDWTSEFVGSWKYQSLGWHSDSHRVWGTIIGIVPILLVTLSSIVLSLVSWVCLRRWSQQTQELFDPNNLLSLLKAGRDGSVVDQLSSPVTARESDSGGSPQGKMKIQLERKESYWAIRPAIPLS